MRLTARLLVTKTTLVAATVAVLSLMCLQAGACDIRSHRADTDKDLLLLLHFDEVAGATLFRDSAPGASHASCHRPVCPQKAERGLEFNGRDTYIMAPVSVQGLSAFTLAGWFYPRSYEHAGKYPITFMAPGADCGRGSLGFGGGNTQGPELYVSDADGCAPRLVVGSSKLLALYEWHHVVAVFDADTDLHAIYVNGQLEAQNHREIGPVPNTTPGHPMWIGVNFSPNPEHCRWWDGYIDEVMLYDRALSALEIQQLYQESAF